MKIKLLLCFLGISLWSVAQKHIVKISDGKIEGLTKDGISSFKGIPFAAPPIGELRWKSPQELKPWKGVKKCTNFGPSPMQSSPTPFMYWSSEFLIPKEPISEDCLYLNVWTGSKNPKEKRPVLVYIYGGGFRSGGAGCPIYDGEALAKKGVIFVSINYRVGIFGFLSHPDLTQESPNHASGNYALLDMVAALKWVHKNISQFGGDPSNVTIAGQSAGAFAVNYLTASALSKGLFQRAIAESGGSVIASPNRPQTDLIAAEKIGEKFAKDLNCNLISELRKKTADEIQNAKGGTSSPIIDGYFLSESISKIYVNGKQNDTPILVGWNKDDRVSGKPLPSKQFKENIIKRFGEFSDAFLSVYPCENDEQAAHSQIGASRDESFGIQNYSWAKLQTQTGKSKAYIYNFNREVPAHNTETQFGAFHTSEVPYAYNNLHTVNRPWEKIDYEIADKMSDYWVNFAKTGNPNGKNLVKWEAYDVKNENVLIIDTEIVSKSLPSKKQMEFWEKYFSKK